MFDKNVKLDIPCPECSYQTKMSLKEIEHNPSYTCAGCNKIIDLNADEFRKELDNVEKKIKDTFK